MEAIICYFADNTRLISGVRSAFLSKLYTY